jgi:hypothetical protein
MLVYGQQPGRAPMMRITSKRTSASKAQRQQDESLIVTKSVARVARASTSH